MGKIRVRTLGQDTTEEQEKKEARLAREARQAKKRQESKKVTKVPGMKGGERVVAVGPTEEELEKLSVSETSSDSATTGKISSEDKKSSATQVQKKKKTQKKPKRSRSKSYQAVAKIVDRTKTYTLSEALQLLPKIKLAKFDETVELHINTLEPGISGNLTLPHGTGKQIRVAIADDNIIDTVAKGKIDFDILLATPQMMPKLAKVAKFLGPRGLMPNPKNGTVTPKPEETAKTYEKGLMRFKTELKAPVIHLTVGKMSFGEKKLTENIKTALNAIQKQNIRKVTLKSTMSPGIKLTIETI